MLEAEANQTPTLLYEGIKRAKGEGVKTEKRVVPLIQTAPEDLYVNEEGDTVEWLCKWHRSDQQEKGQRWKDQEFIIVYLMNLQESIGRGRRDSGGEDQVGSI